MGVVCLGYGGFVFVFGICILVFYVGLVFLSEVGVLWVEWLVEVVVSGVLTGFIGI